MAGTHRAGKSRCAEKDQGTSMKLKLRIGRQRAQDCDTDEPRTTAEPANRAPEPQPVRTAPPAAARMPQPRTPVARVVRAGSFCRATEVGQTAVTETGRAVLAIRAGRCGRWVYDDHA